MKNRILPLLLLLLLPLIAAPATAAPALIADECATCGKTIYFGERCLTCIAKEAREAREHPCADCGKSILIGPRCAACTWEATRAHLAHDCAGCGKEILIGSLCAICSAQKLEGTLRGLYARGAELAPEVQEALAALVPGGLDAGAMKEAALREAAERKAALERFAAVAAQYAAEKGVAVGETLEDLEVKRRALQVVGAAATVADRVERTKLKVAEVGIGKVAKMPVRSELGWTTLEDLARFKLIEVAPSMEGTDLAQDPAAVLASLVVADHLYFLMDLDLVATPAGPISIVEALERKSGEDAEGTLACLAILRSVRDIKRGHDLTRSVRDISRSLEILNPHLFEGEESGEGEGGE